MDEITGNQRDQRDQHEGGVGRTAVEGHRGQQVVHQLERRRVSTERVKQHQGRSDGEDPDLARPRKAADKAEGQDGDQGQPAGVNEPTQAGVAGSLEILQLVESLSPGDLGFALISGD